MNTFKNSPAKVINILGNEKLKVKNMKIHNSVVFKNRIMKIIPRGTIFLENDFRIIIDGLKFKLMHKNSWGLISKHSPAYRQIKRSIAIMQKRYRTHRIFNNGVFRIEKKPNLQKIRESIKAA